MATLSSIITPSNVETASSTSTLTNKTISGSSNTITNVPLSTAVTGTLPVANGGTGASSLSAAGILTTASAVTVAQGGTGATSLTANNVLLGNGTSAVQVVAPGSSGNVLTSNGTTWASSAPSTGALVLISSTSVSSPVAAFEITSGFSSTYDDYLLLGENFKLSGSSSYTVFRIYTGGTLRSTSGYVNNRLRWQTATSVASETNGSEFQFTNGGDTDSVLSFTVYILNANSTSYTNSFIINVAQGSTASTNTQGVCSFGNYKGDANAVTGIRLQNLGGDNFTTGTLRLYGIKKS